MAWNISDRFPSWGETGEFPADGFFYERNDQVNEKHLDALWNGLNELEGEVQAALNDIDSDGDGKVDNADLLDGVEESDLLSKSGDFMQGDLNINGNNIKNVYELVIYNNDGDLDSWVIKEDFDTGDINFRIEGGGMNSGTKMNIDEYNGNVRIEGELIEGASL